MSTIKHITTPVQKERKVVAVVGYPPTGSKRLAVLSSSGIFIVAGYSTGYSLNEIETTWQEYQKIYEGDSVTVTF